MTSDIRGLHHVTLLAGDARATDAFFTGTLGLRRVKKTVNFDAPEVYHLYYGDATGAPGTVITHFPFPGIGPGRRGAGEAGTTVFAVPEGALPWWEKRLTAAGVAGIAREVRFGAAHLRFAGPDGEGLALTEVPGDARPGWEGGGIPAEVAIRGMQAVALTLADAAPMAELLRFLGYGEVGREGAVTHFVRAGGNGAEVVDLEQASGARPAVQGAGSVHHVAFAVPDRAAQDRVRRALAGTGLAVTKPIDRDYFWSVYFRAPGGVLFEVATDAPGFARDEDLAHLGEALKLPRQHEHLRSWLEAHLAPIVA
jgi:glyoxalase family protein